VSAPRWLPAAGVVLAAALFAWLNRGERIVVNLGLFRLYRAPLTVVVFLAFLAGMLAMLALSLRHDRRVREELRRRGLLDIPPPVEPARPVSAWGVAREPARADGARPWTASAPSHADDAPTLAQAADGHAASDPREEDRTVVHPREDERRPAYPRLDEDPAV
jgi:uncharacterized integral membrane protein